MRPKHIPTRELLSDKRYLQLLARDFPTMASVAGEIINLEAILHLPKPTEHFLADLHGENEAFQHVLRNASGNIRRKVTELFGSALRESEMRDFCTLIYYPEQKLKLVRQTETDLPDYYQTTLNRLVAVARAVSSKYTRSKVRKSLPSEFAYIIEELLHEQAADHDKQAYVGVIIETIIATRRADDFITALCRLIQQLAIDRLHVLGDLFDRGPGAHLILDTLEQYHHFDIQWGNHDVLWMGAAAGNLCCIASVLRLSLRYANTKTLEEGYAINLFPLASFATDTYGDDPCELFQPKVEQGSMDSRQQRLVGLMHKAVSVMQFKLEAQLLSQHPEWGMDDRRLVEHIDTQAGTVEIAGRHYPLRDTHFPTIDPEHPARLSAGEQDVMDRLCHSFLISEKLQRHVQLLLLHGGMYTVCNSNLLFHASVPLEQDGTLRESPTPLGTARGRALMDEIDHGVHIAFEPAAEETERKAAQDFFWYLWCGPDSPLFGKSKMATFERYLLSDKATHEEAKGWYYELRQQPQICEALLDEFGVCKHRARHIINGHVPVRQCDGESPIKADGRLMVIDGGFSKAYHKTTGIAGYTLVYHSRGFQLVQHEPFTSTQDAIERGTDIRSTEQIVEQTGTREMVDDTDIGRDLREQIKDLEKLLAAYRRGIIKEK